jgi:hypothetical protein
MLDVPLVCSIIFIFFPYVIELLLNDSADFFDLLIVDVFLLLSFICSRLLIVFQDVVQHAPANQVELTVVIVYLGLLGAAEVHGRWVGGNGRRGGD